MSTGDSTKTTISTYNHIAKDYLQFFDYYLTDKEHMDEFVKLLPTGGKILDVGCGPGGTTEYFTQKGFTVNGIDLSEEMLKYAKEKVPNGEFENMDMRNLRYPDESCDAIHGAYSIIHIPHKDMPRTLREWNRVLKKDGLVFLSFYKGEGEKFIVEPMANDRKSFVSYFTLEEMKDLLKEAGFGTVYEKEFKVDEPEDFYDTTIIVIARKG